MMSRNHVRVKTMKQTSMDTATARTGTPASLADIAARSSCDRSVTNAQNDSANNATNGRKYELNCSAKQKHHGVVGDMGDRAQPDEPRSS